MQPCTPGTEVRASAMASALLHLLSTVQAKPSRYTNTTASCPRTGRPPSGSMCTASLATSKLARKQSHLHSSITGAEPFQGHKEQTRRSSPTGSQLTVRLLPSPCIATRLLELNYSGPHGQGRMIACRPAGRVLTCVSPADPTIAHSSHNRPQSDEFSVVQLQLTHRELQAIKGKTGGHHLCT